MSAATPPGLLSSNLEPSAVWGFRVSGSGFRGLGLVVSRLGFGILGLWLRSVGFMELRYQGFSVLYEGFRGLLTFMSRLFGGSSTGFPECVGTAAMGLTHRDEHRAIIGFFEGCFSEGCIGTHQRLAENLKRLCWFL